MSIINTKRGDTEVTLKVNMDLTESTVRVLVRPRRSTGFTVLPSTVTVAAKGTLTAVTSDLPVGLYDLEVEVTQGGKVSTFPDTGYVILSVNADLG